MSVIKERFVIRYYSYAQKAAKSSGIPVLFALAQSALESGWGKYIKGNMMFGIKRGAGINYGGWQGDTQYITTTEYSSKPTRNFPFVYPGYPIQINNGKWKYKIKDVFRAYTTPFYSFIDWAGMLFKSRRYQNALYHKKNPYRFAEEIAKAGYATDPNYANKIKRIMKEIQQIIILKKLNKNQKEIGLPLILMGVSLLIISVVVINRKPK
ncbi:peptidoglycan hydrolase [Aquimarina sp. TRL1]|uniref:glycoside hydrolase family 73 protein n=1 Tax=Aquimarina sp. (strain TRL1) TaxID=2736252 RepID=UPI00158C7D54|nr:glucosaminidase domain-containing protein [Aquimarina sp. TRL1]QKX05378.1 peptidoglycan hydrolase [Aquimarina sp. TRL1]